MYSPLTYNQACPAEVAQWTIVFGVTDASATKSSVEPTGAQDTWVRTAYKDSPGTVVLKANGGGFYGAVTAYGQRRVRVASW